MTIPLPDPPASLAPGSAGLPPGLSELLLDSTSDGVFAVDVNRRIIAFNRAAELTLGIDRARAIGRPCHEVIRSAACRECCPLALAQETGEPVVNLAVDLLDVRDRRVPVTMSSAVLRDRRGRVIGGVETFRNLTWVKNLLHEVERSHPFAEIVSDDPHMKQVFEILPTLAQSESTILLHGETGTGKSLIARAVHNLSPRRERPLVTINSGALPETLLESELFGYRKGAFTGATRDRQGRIAAAEGGTLFLDEIGDMSAAMQVKLLRFLQDQVYEPLGDTRTVQADVRVVAATNRNLARMVEEGRFRRDLYYRINVLSLELPPLRERRRDIPLLAQRCLERLCRSRGKRLDGFSAEAVDALMAHDYPGNIRELENVVEHAFVLCPGPVIGPEHLPEHHRGGAAAAGSGRGRSLQDYEARGILDALARAGG
ncbi:MAG: sigma 54-interacting transcriptional regulator, partial [Krumholzibacteria bacterium]|nr:sigma 54-interacting transcriptional regulator [Candidatus Krumholzibacteria bacterium]